MESNKPTRRSLLGAIGGSLVLAGCVGGDDDNGDENGGTDSDDGSAANGDQNGTDQNGTDQNGTDQNGTDQNGTDDGMDTPTVTVTSHDEHGDVLAGPDGLTLYMFDQDEQGAGESACYDSCADNWPPLTVEDEPAAGDGVDAALSTIEREDGSMQVVANGWPLYYFASDEAPGDTNGQGVGDVWWVLAPDGTPVRGSGGDGGNGTEAATVTVRSHDEYGDVLAGPDGLTLYMFDQDEQGAGESVCSGDCANAWPPLTVDGEPVAGDGIEAGLTTFEREGGSTQVAANGWPLYYFANDEAPGDANGQAVNDVWWVLAPDGTPVRDSGGDNDGGSNGDDNGGGGNNGSSDDNGGGGNNGSSDDNGGGGNGGDDDGGYDPY
jgi:predicted lipoprotein with Yx(FWY)xxD motif